MKNKKTLIIVVSLLVAVLGITFAYVIPEIMAGAISNVGISSNTADMLDFDTGEDMGIVITQFNLTPTSGDLTTSTTASASLTANNYNNEASYTYNVYFKINSNSYIYTTSDNKPEIILTISGPNGVVKSIDGLTYHESLGGFDITTKTGIIKVQENIPISSNLSTTATVQSWTFTIKFINLDSNQGKNVDNSMTANVIIGQDKQYATFAEQCLAENINTFACDIIKTAASDETLLLHNADLTNGAGDNSYRYAGASDVVNNYVCFGSNETSCPDENLYRIIGVFDDGTGAYRVKLIMNDGATSGQLGTNGDYKGSYVDGSSYYKGNNYDNIASYYWNATTANGGTAVNTWSKSRLNTVNLNTNFTNYINNLGNNWYEKIADTTWKVGGGSATYLYSGTPEVAYSYELGEKSLDTTYNAKIGLMYVSDFGYAAYPDAWNTILSGYNSATIRDNNWMYMGLLEWTMTCVSDTTNNVYRTFHTGSGNYNLVYFNNSARPVFYLNSSVELKSGNGSANLPYRI